MIMNKMVMRPFKHRVPMLSPKMRFSNSLTWVIQTRVSASGSTGMCFQSLMLINYSTNSKAALAKDLVDGIEKDLEKLKRQQENIQLRKHLAITG